MGYKIDEKNKAFCLAPWMSAHVWPSGQTFPCCLWDIHEPMGNINDTPLEEIWNNSKMKDTRLSMLKGEKLKPCTRCYELEDAGYGSYRKDINTRHGKNVKYVDDTKEDGTLEEMNLHLWDFRLSNFCNFKCRSCGLGLSSTWYQDTVALKTNENLKEIGSLYYNNQGIKKALETVNDKVSFLEIIEPHYTCVDEVYFAGGEPLMMPEHYTILDKLIETGRTDVWLRYSTNFSSFTFKGKNIFDYWRQFKQIQLWISIDGVGKIGEYVRKGFSDSKFEANITRLKEENYKFTDIGYIVTYGALNFLHIFDLVLNFIEREYVDYGEPFLGNKQIHFNPISHPKYYDSKFLPTRYKEAFLNRLQTFEQEMKAIGASDYFASNVMEKLATAYNRSIETDFDFKEMQELKVLTQELDLLRDEKFENTFGYFKVLDDLTDNRDHTDLPRFTYPVVVSDEETRNLI